MTQLADMDARKRALNPQRSFIVQAPAGSGKTELLIQRYLNLLLHVEDPESILALTFTRKAAMEMRSRVMEALEKAQVPLDPTRPLHEIARYHLAKAVLKKNQEKNWQLLANLNRFRIQTIDSFCQRLTRQMPLLSALTDKFSPVEQPAFLYRLAAQELLASLESSTPWQKALTQLLAHLDNRVEYLTELLTQVLANREQWIPYLTTDPITLRKHLESSLQQVRHEQVQSLNERFPKAYFSELTALLDFSFKHRPQTHLEWTELKTEKPDFRFWYAASCLLLKENNQWRQQVTHRDGFPSPSSEKDPDKKEHYRQMKQRATDLCAGLANQNELLMDLIRLKNAPPAAYTPPQWTILEALCDLLPVLVAHLKVVFQTYRQVDYSEILLGALRALGDEESPTDLALHLDYQIQHMLIDEFQDTSITQFALIKKLTATWQPEEDKTLFLVGDPMQSIYRFRKAEVGLFLHVQKKGIGMLPCETLYLTVNFRSNANLVAWINQAFSTLLPKQENSHQGAITFTPSVAAQTASAIKPAVQLIYFPEPDPQREANKIVSLLKTLRTHSPNDSIAILVRARTHLLHLLPTLKAAKIAYQAIEIETLTEKSVIQDLICLTRALFHLGDRISWFALLRTPFCGLDLRDLHEMAHFHTAAKNDILWEKLLCFESIPLRLTSKQRLRRIVPILKQAFLQKKHALSMAIWIKQTWLALGGPMTLDTKDSFIAVQTYFHYLEKQNRLEKDVDDFSDLETELAKLSLPSTPSQPGCIDIMTIHKAKGLEYDHILLPSLHRQGAQDKEKIWRYEERFSAHQPRLIIAPIKASDQKADPIYHYLSFADKQKADYELTRLLYVASTRARRSLTFLAYQAETKTSAPTQSLLAQLQPALQTHDQSILSIINESSKKPMAPPCDSKVRWLKRCSSTWKNTFSLFNDTTRTKETAFEDSASEDSDSVLLGIITHRLLYQMSQGSLADWEAKQTPAITERFERWLRQCGVSHEKFTKIIPLLIKTFTKILSDPRGRWLFDPSHRDAKAEYSLTVAKFGRQKQWIIDRYFIDQHGTHWIIDYKITTQTITEPERFLNEAFRLHQNQLETYADALQRNPSFPKQAAIRLGIYFPYQSLWYEWSYQTKTCVQEVFDAF